MFAQMAESLPVLAKIKDKAVEPCFLKMASKTSELLMYVVTDRRGALEVSTWGDRARPRVPSELQALGLLPYHIRFPTSGLDPRCHRL